MKKLFLARKLTHCSSVTRGPLTEHGDLISSTVLLQPYLIRRKQIALSKDIQKLKK